MRNRKDEGCRFSGILFRSPQDFYKEYREKEKRYGQNRIYWNGKYGFCSSEGAAEGVPGRRSGVYGQDGRDKAQGIRGNSGHLYPVKRGMRQQLQIRGAGGKTPVLSPGAEADTLRGHRKSRSDFPGPRHYHRTDEGSTGLR